MAIQEAINSAVDGDTIFVKAGAYYEHVVVNRTVSIVGEDVDTTIIDGNNTGHVINVISQNVNISGFTVQNSGNVHWPALEAGICLNSTTDCSVSENRLVDNGFAGISLLNSQRNTITGNNATGTGWGAIHLLNSSNNTVSENILDSNTYVGINGHASSQPQQQQLTIRIPHRRHLRKVLLLRLQVLLRHNPNRIQSSLRHHPLP
jgi:parallel beta-helix repeat (two copies)